MFPIQELLGEEDIVSFKLLLLNVFIAEHLLKRHKQ